ncbi:MAG: hypothetical protein HYU66_26005 [Armatimonadetes bacterium]|nr:hypothetical protein [Armatimonadota bacterium]
MSDQRADDALGDLVREQARLDAGYGWVNAVLYEQDSIYRETLDALLAESGRGVRATAAGELEIHPVDAP